MSWTGRGLDVVAERKIPLPSRSEAQVACQCTDRQSQRVPVADNQTDCSDEARESVRQADRRLH